MGLFPAVLDWLHLAGALLVLIALQLVQFIIVWSYHLFPFPGLLDAVYNRSRQLQGWFHLHLKPTDVEGRRSARELVESEGFYFENHFLTTEDGFVLVLHRVIAPSGLTAKSTTAATIAAAAGNGGNSGDMGCGNGDDSCGVSVANGGSNDGVPNGGGARMGSKMASGPKNGKKVRPPILLMHGLMQDSEALLCGGRDHSLALILAANGYDVFVGNNRGNRYSHKNLSKAPHEERYWDFSIDELARLDVPAMVHHVLATTGAEKAVYIGFSQGSAQAFAALSSNAALQSKVALMVALSPAARAQGLAKSLLSSLVAANLRFLNLLFGRRRVLPTTLMWQRIMSRDTFVRAVDQAMLYLFTWRSTMVSPERKRQLYPHIYSYSSVKCVSHWFQMIRSRRLAMFEDAPPGQYIPVAYDITQIKIPVALFYGGRDTIVEVASLCKTLPRCVLAYCEPDFEHLDTMWGDIAAKTIFPKVLALLRDL
ncbi:unnamed protein product [Phaeothamnion confervicola]